MHVTHVAPGARLAPFVRRFTVVETAAEATRALLPEAGLVLGVRFGGSASMLDGEAVTRVPDTSIVGIVGAARRMRTSAGGGVVLAVFRETGAARFFAEPLHELFGRTLSLSELVPRAELARVQQRIAEAPDRAQRIARLEQFLVARLRPEAPDRVADAAVAAIRRAHGSLRIAQLARELGISQDPLEKRFRRVVGTTPKQLATLLRLRHVIDRAALPFGSAAGRAQVPAVDQTALPFGSAAGRAQVPAVDRGSGGAPEAEGGAREVGPTRRGPAARASWSRLAIEAGYFDQSHFIREFRTMAGEAPERFFRAGTHC